MKKLIISLMLIVVGLGITILTYSAVAAVYLGDLSNIKIITFVFTALLVGNLSYHLLKNKKLRYVFMVLIDMVCTMSIILLNNFWHYEEFISRFGNYGVTYDMFLINDINYTYGLGIFRYILFFVLILITYVMLDINFTEKIKRKISSSNLKEKFMKFVGLEKVNYDLVTENEDIDKLKHIIEKGACEIYKSQENGLTIYHIEIDKQMK